MQVCVSKNPCELRDDSAGRTTCGVKLPTTLTTNSFHLHLPSCTAYIVLLAAENPVTMSMADPFEVRMRFTSQLQHLNASVTSSQKAAHYALKYRDMDEDLHSCILEQLERVGIHHHTSTPDLER